MIILSNSIVQHNAHFWVVIPIPLGGFKRFRYRGHGITYILRGQHELQPVAIRVIEIVGSNRSGSKKYRSILTILPLSAKFLSSTLRVSAYRLVHFLQLYYSLTKRTIYNEYYFAVSASRDARYSVQFIHVRSSTTPNVRRIKVWCWLQCWRAPHNGQVFAAWFDRFG